MPTITTQDGTQIFYKDWGPRDGRVIMFHHGWPLSSDDWDGQMMFFVGKGYRVIAHDRRGHGRSTQAAAGHDMDTYVADATAVTDALDLREAIHIGHSTGGGEVARYVARARPGRVAKAVLVSAVAPLMLKTAANPNGVPKEVFDGIREQTATNRAQFFLDFTLPFFGYNREGAQVKEAVRRNWWRQGMEGSALAHYLGVAAFSETDFTEDLKAISVPTRLQKIEMMKRPYFRLRKCAIAIEILVFKRQLGDGFSGLKLGECGSTLAAYGFERNRFVHRRSLRAKQPGSAAKSFKPRNPDPRCPQINAFSTCNSHTPLRVPDLKVRLTRFRVTPHSSGSVGHVESSVARAGTRRSGLGGGG